MSGSGRWIAQAVFYAAVMAVIGFFSRAPVYRHLAPDEALVRVSIAHAPERLHPCRIRTADELAKMPPNMRAAEDCPRERSPIVVELEVDGVRRWGAEAPPAGLQGDGLATLYHRLPLAAGEHRVTVRLRDRPGDDFNHVRTEMLRLAGGDSIVIDFNAARGGFVFRR